MRKKSKLVIIIICCMALQFLSLSACSNSNKVVSETSKKQEVSTAPSKQETTAETADDMQKTDINKNDTGKTVIKAISLSNMYPNNSYMIISKSGTVIVADPTQVIDGIKPDIITSTSVHHDHVDLALYDKSNCKKSKYTVEAFSVKDVNVFSIASSGTAGDINKDKPSNVIYVYEVDGLRIAHMGDVWQDKLTDEQMKALGKIDLAFTQFINEDGFKLIEQLKPQIIVPTYSDAASTKKISDIV